MTTFSIRDAAKEAGVSKTSILRAIQSGRMSAPRKDDGGYAIDPAELFRVFPPKAEGQRDSASTRSEGQTVPPEGLHGTDYVSTRTTELEVRLAKAEAQIEGLKEILEVERKRAEELRQERDKWSGLAEVSQRQLVDLSKRPRGFLGWLKSL
jgi:uncharacterized coiled-coil protein SlyX